MRRAEAARGRRAAGEGRASPPPVVVALLAAVPPLFGLVALALGQDANWDLRNYHYYNGWAFFHRRWDWDVLAAQLPGFYNPALDIPYYWLTEHLSARAVGFVLGTVQGLVFVPLYFLARAVLVAGGRGREPAALGLALAGMLGADTLSEYGTVFHDDVVALGIVGAAAIVAWRWDRLWAPGSGWIGWACAAGLAAGLAFGLKQNNVVFAVGGCGAFLFVPGERLRRRVALAFVYGLGVLAGLAAAGGPWMLHLWARYANPLFPFYNQIFHSPWALARDYRDTGFLPPRFDLAETLSLPWRFSFRPRLVSEADFRDFRLLAAYVLLPLAGLATVLRRGRAPTATFTRPGPTAYLVALAALAYFAWLYLFRIYRYLVPLEMLAPLLVVAALGRLPGPPRARAAAAVAVVALLVASVRPADWLRVEWGARAVQVAVPPVAEPDKTLVLMAGLEPLSYLLPAFPPGMRFVRIDSNFTNPSQHEVAFNGLMRRIVAAHRGPLAVLYAEHEAGVTRGWLAEYGLVVEAGGCRSVAANLAPDVRYRYCPARPAGAGSAR